MTSETRHSGVWILAEQAGGEMLPVSFELLARGRQLADKRGCDLTALVLGDALTDEQLQTLIDRGADAVLAIEAAELAQFDLEPYAACMVKLIEDRRPEIVIAAATSTGRTLMPYAAVKATAGLTADCTVLDIEPETGNLLQTRPAIGGNILATIKTPNHRPQMATVRPHSTRPALPQAGRTGQVERISPQTELLASRVKRIGFDPNTDEHRLTDAERIVTVGRGIKKAQNLPIAQALAAQLDAAIGATRDVVDRGWLSYPHQIGLSGKTVTPKLYVGIGASGSIQHLAGMQTSETIVAINNDPEAQIFQVADFGIVADLFEVLPILTDKIRNTKQQIRSKPE